MPRRSGTVPTDHSDVGQSVCDEQMDLFVQRMCAAWEEHRRKVTSWAADIEREPCHGLFVEIYRVTLQWLERAETAVGAMDGLVTKDVDDEDAFSEAAAALHRDVQQCAQQSLASWEVGDVPDADLSTFEHWLHDRRRCFSGRDAWTRRRDSRSCVSIRKRVASRFRTVKSCCRLSRRSRRRSNWTLRQMRLRFGQSAADTVSYCRRRCAMDWNKRKGTFATERSSNASCISTMKPPYRCCPSTNPCCSASSSTLNRR